MRGQHGQSLKDKRESVRAQKPQVSNTVGERPISYNIGEKDKRQDWRAYQTTEKSFQLFQKNKQTKQTKCIEGNPTFQLSHQYPTGYIYDFVQVPILPPGGLAPGLFTIPLRVLTFQPPWGPGRVFLERAHFCADSHPCWWESWG